MLLTALHYALSRGRDGIHYSGFIDSGSEASSAPHRLVCTIHQLSIAVRIAYYSSSSPIRPSIHSLAVRSWAMDASQPLWKKVRQAALPGQGERTLQR